MNNKEGNWGAGELAIIFFFLVLSSARTCPSDKEAKGRRKGFGFFFVQSTTFFLCFVSTVQGKEMARNCEENGEKMAMRYDKRLEKEPKKRRSIEESDNANDK